MPSPLLIGSDWVQTQSALKVLSPYDGALVGEVWRGDATHLERAVAAAHQAFALTRKQPAFERAEILHRLATQIEAHRGEFVRLMIAEAGKPRSLADVEVTRVVSTFQLAAELARETSGHLLNLDAFASGAGHRGLVQRFPLGVIYGLTPFNFPLNLVAHKVAPALATGNTIVIKPSPQTPLTALLLGQLALAAGVPAGQLNVVCCANEEAQAPLIDDRVKMVSFTGSAAVGWKIKAACGKKKVALELGGNAAAIVHDDAVLEKAIPLLAAGAFGYAGQSCISTQRIFIHETIYDSFCEQFVAYTRTKIKTGDPSAADVAVGPMINATALKRIQGWIASAREAGATILLGGEAKGNCLEPTVVAVPHQKMDLCKNEAFAPVVTLHRYASFEEAIAEVNASVYGLQAAVFTQTMGRIFQAFEQLDVGGVLINEAPTYRSDGQPYGGVKDSGFGREGLRYAMEEMTELKALILRSE